MLFYKRDNPIETTVTVKVKTSMLVLLCEYSVDLILTTVFQDLTFISNVVVAYISNVTVYIFFTTRYCCRFHWNI